MLCCGPNSIATEIYVFERVSDFSVFDSFDCRDKDLNEFIRDDAKRHKAELIAETYSFSFQEAGERSSPVAFVSLSNDSIRLNPAQLEILPPGLRYRELPAVKIARLGVDGEYQGRQIGTEIINIIKGLFTTHNRTGCRFISVDAYNQPRVLGFYESNGFEYLTEKDAKKATRIMFFDLKNYVDSGEQPS